MTTSANLQSGQDYVRIDSPETLLKIALFRLIATKVKKDAIPERDEILVLAQELGFSNPEWFFNSVNEGFRWHMERSIALKVGLPGTAR